MPKSHLLKNWVPVSALFHLTLLVLASMIPWTPHRPADVMVVDLTDLPRSADFPPPRPGIVEGARPKPPPPSPPKPARKEKPPVPPPRELVGRVPDLPVNPDLPPEQEFPVPRQRGRDGGKGRGEGGDLGGTGGRGPPHGPERPGDPVHLLLREHQAEDRARLAVSARCRERGDPGRADPRFRHRAERGSGVRGASAGFRPQDPGGRGVLFHPQGGPLQPDPRALRDPQPADTRPLHLRDAHPEDPVGSECRSSAGKSRSYSSPLRRAPNFSGSDGRMVRSLPPTLGSVVMVSGDSSTAGFTAQNHSWHAQTSVREYLRSVGAGRVYIDVAIRVAASSVL